MNFDWHLPEQKWKSFPPNLSVRVSGFRLTVMPQTGSMAVEPVAGASWCVGISSSVWA
ncbi:hypothetical protein MLD63_17515 [Paracoccus sp. TK19116]|uniref:Uncharacterized protein n=1 Tax=Paracoccus albicereus TaxID=2922394 RepID=A0ABT1MV76_9RHOB|nr:hypothetical protein [Paracoccus albicereus]MCQ0972220.1 hypothetical protein [Paracoccus albicereus]